jgi:hypothetical protein
MEVKVGIVQSAYIPWKGYFDIIKKCNKFVFFDSVQFSKRSWVTRNKIKSPMGTKWLSVPTSGSTTQKINEVEISNLTWMKSHLSSIKQSYNKTDFYSVVESLMYSAHSSCGGSISKFNIHFVSETCKYLGIDTELIDSSEIPQSGAKSDLLISICNHLGATAYISGPSAKAYIGEEFDNAGIKLEWMDYSNYPKYDQLHGEFEHQVSIVDLLCMKGNQAVKFF